MATDRDGEEIRTDEDESEEEENDIDEMFSILNWMWPQGVLLNGCKLFYVS